MIHIVKNRLNTIIVLLPILAISCSPSPKYLSRKSRSKKDRDHITVSENVSDAPSAQLDAPVKNFSMARITSFFGIRKDPIYGTEEPHKGIDIRTKRGEQIFASADGIVAYSGKQSGFGKVVIIDHGNRLFTVYAHLSICLVKEGTKVKKGDVIGRAGDSGKATNCHVHFEVRYKGKAIDPLRFLRY